ncbi:MAG: hypothetical protein WA130_05465 [Candidatus Methanoperedens sp.]
MGAQHLIVSSAPVRPLHIPHAPGLSVGRELGENSAGTKPDQIE